MHRIWFLYVTRKNGDQNDCDTTGMHGWKTLDHAWQLSQSDVCGWGDYVQNFRQWTVAHNRYKCKQIDYWNCVGATYAQWLASTRGIYSSLSHHLINVGSPRTDLCTSSECERVLINQSICSALIPTIIMFKPCTRDVHKCHDDNLYAFIYARSLKFK